MEKHGFENTITYNSIIVDQVMRSLTAEYLGLSSLEGVLNTETYKRMLKRIEVKND